MKHFYLFLCLLLAFRGLGQTPAILNGVVQTEAGTPLPGATVFLKDTYIGGSTNEGGRFEVRVQAEQFPATLVVSFVGFETQEIALSQPASNLEVTMRPSALLNQVVVAASRVAETIGQAPVTVEKLNQRQVQQLTTPDLVAGLGRLQGVDISASSMLTAAFSTRGFNSSRSERVIQLSDYMDTQLPSLSGNFGNLLGTPILDIGSVELVHGPASALYGANAFNGVLLTNSRDPFTDPGLTVRLRGGNRSLLDGQLRYAVRLGERVAFKLSGGALVADDFVADNQDATSRLIEPANNQAGSPLGYDAVSRYGDAGAYTFGTTFTNPATGQQVTTPTSLLGRTLFLPGFSERDLVADDHKTHSYKVMPSLAVLLSSTVKATLDYRYVNATTTFQSASRYRAVNTGAHQERLQVEGRNWFVRGYSTQDFSGGGDQNAHGSYNLGFLGGFLQNQLVPGTNISYGQRYVGTYLATLAGGLNGGATADAATVAAYAVAGGTTLQPGTAAFTEARNRVASSSTPGQGAHSVLRSILSDASGQYNFKTDVADIIVGGAYRQFRLGSDGSLFADSRDGARILNYEYGGYAQVSKAVANERLKLSAAARVDHFQNFGTAVSPRGSVVYSAGADKQQNFRLSYSRAFRSPIQSDQYVHLDVGRAILLGNVGGGYSGYSPALGAALAANPNVLGQPAALATYNYRGEALRLEEVNSFEGGYRAQLSKALYVEANYYYSFYNHFIATQNFIGNTDGSRPTPQQLATAAAGRFQNPALLTRVIQISANVDQQVRSQGAGITLGYVVGPALTLMGNYSFNDLITKDFQVGTQSFFNTPRHKFNLGLDGQALGRALSYNVNYRWADSFLYESTFATGTVPVAKSFDAQVGYTIKPLRTTVQAGVTNLFDQTNYSVYGAPQFGRLGFFGLLFDVK